MHQLISRPAVYLVIGIGVLALLISQFQGSDNQARTSVSELDPFGSSETVSEKNLVKSTPVVEAISSPASVNRVEMVRDEMTSTESYQQTNASLLNNDTAETQPVEAASVVETFDSPLELVNDDAVEAKVPTVNPINAIDDSLTVLELDGPISLDSEASKERYQLDDIAGAIVEVTEEVVETTTSSIDPLAQNDEPKTDAQPTATFENTKARILKGTEDSMRPRGWRTNPFIAESTPVSESVVIETSGNETLPTPDIDESLSLDTISSTQINEADPVSTVGNFEPKNAPSVVNVIPSREQPMQSVMSVEPQFSQPNESLPTVIGLPDSVAHKAVHNIEYGKSLSRRGAAFAARQEFYSSLRILAQAHDTQAGGTAYTQALRDAIIALKEAEDFIVSDTETQIGLNVDAVVEGHSTKLISATEASNMTAIEAMQRYFAFASSQLRVSSGQNAVAAEALYCLGKLHTVQAKFGTNASKLDIAKAIVFHQAAIASDGSNFRSANELGVLMANSGRLQESQDMLKRSLQIQQLPQAWKNLAVVHQRSGQDQLAQLAQKEFLISSQQNSTGMSDNTIRWVETAQFNQGTPLELRQGAPQQKTLQPTPPRNANKPTISQRLKSLF
jgi:tetratricopeptide (TPR) repeat protein